MTLRLTKNSALSKKPFVITQRPSKSLRIAFWSLITSSGICWTLALLLGSSLLSSCSGSIFSSEGKSPPADIAPANGGGGENDSDRGVAPPPPAYDENDPNISIVDRGSGRGRVVTDVRTLTVFEILAPAKVLEWTRNMNENQERDLLSRLSLNIAMGPATKSGKDNILRTVNFYISRNNVNVSRSSNAQAPYATLTMFVSTDETTDAGRKIFASGTLQNRDDGSSEFIALTLSLKKGSKNSYTMTEGSRFIEYSEAGDPLEGYRLNDNTMIKFSIQDRK